MIIGARTLAKRAIVYEILKQSGRLGDFLNNPQLFIKKVTEIILNVRHTLAIDGISYKMLYGESKTSEITEAVEDALPGQLNKMQKSRKVSNILQKMKKNGIADTKGKGAGALWFILYN